MPCLKFSSIQMTRSPTVDLYLSRKARQSSVKSDYACPPLHQVTGIPIPVFQSTCPAPASILDTQRSPDIASPA